MTVKVIRPGQVTFDKIYRGKMFQWDSGIYVKTAEDSAVVIYKFAGHMNEGQSELIAKDTIVWQITEAVFTVGDYLK